MKLGSKAEEAVEEGDEEEMMRGGYEVLGRQEFSQGGGEPEVPLRERAHED